ncbi:hypothetical protein V6Z11_A12G309000 [Gossypium hirsutum]
MEGLLQAGSSYFYYKYGYGVLQKFFVNFLRFSLDEHPDMWLESVLSDYVL